MDEGRRVFRSDRCFCSDEGKLNEQLRWIEQMVSLKADQKQEVDNLRKDKVREMTKVLTELYIAHTGSDEPTTELKFRQLIVRAIATRLQVLLSFPSLCYLLIFA